MAYLTEDRTGIAVALTSERVAGIQMKDGKVLWEVELPDNNQFKYNMLQVYDGTVYVVGMTTGSEVKVMAIDGEGSSLFTKSVMAGFIRKETRYCNFGSFVQSSLLSVLLFCPKQYTVSVVVVKFKLKDNLK